jgi:predicted tellurium resistance membrane protein TerC
MMLILDAFEQHVPRGYLYFAMAFSVAVEMVNIRVRAKSVPQRAPVDLRGPVMQPDERPRD